MKRGEKVNEETIEEARQLRREGYSFNEIARKVNLSKSTVVGYCRDIKPGAQGEEPPAESPGLPAASQSKDKIPSSDEVVQGTNELRLMELAVAKAKTQAQLDLLQEEADLRGEERLALVDERRQRLVLGNLPPGSETPEAEAARKSLAEIEAMREELRAKRQELEEEKHRIEMDNLKELIGAQNEAIAGLKNELSKSQGGRNQYDIISEALQAVREEARGVRGDVVTLLNAQQTRDSFNPERTTAAERRQQGDRLASMVEREAGRDKPAATEGDGAKPYETSAVEDEMTPAPQPKIMPTDTRLISCQRCGAEQEIDLNELRLALKEDGQPREKAFTTCQNPKCGVRIEISDLIPDLLRKTGKKGQAPPFIYE